MIFVLVILVMCDNKYLFVNGFCMYVFFVDIEVVFIRLVKLENEIDGW